MWEEFQLDPTAHPRLVCFRLQASLARLGLARVDKEQEVVGMKGSIKK